MWVMSVTLEVSRLSGWLNACAPCRAERRACDAGQGAGREGGERVWGVRWRKRHARGRPDSRLLGVRARAERTRNMEYMLVTLDVSKLSGWLNTVASCRVEGRGMRCGARCGPGGGRVWGGAGGSGMHRGKARLKAFGCQGTRGAHVEHVGHVRDLGRVEAQRLVEPRLLPSRWEGMRCGARCRPGGGRAWGGGGASGMHGEGPSQGLGARARAGRTWNMLDMAVTLEVSKLSGWLKGEAYRVEGRGMRCVARCGPGGGREWGCGAAEAGCTGGRPATQGVWGSGHARSARGTWRTCL